MELKNRKHFNRSNVINQLRVNVNYDLEQCPRTVGVKKVTMDKHTLLSCDKKNGSYNI